MRGLLALLVLGFALIPAPGIGEAQHGNLARIQEQVEAQQREMTKTASRQVDLEKQLRAQERRLQELRARAHNLNAEVARVRAEERAAELELRAAEERSKTVKEISLKRARTVYMRRRDVAAEELVWFVRGDDFMRNAFFLGKVKEYDAELLGRLLALRNERAEAALRLGALANNRALLQASLWKEERSIEESLTQGRRLREELRREQARMERAMAALRAEALRLETVVRSLTTPDEEAPAAVQKDVAARHGEAENGEYDGAGLKPGTLPPPVEGRVRRPFGKYQVSGFQDMVANKGIEFACAEGAPVRAVAEGRVMYQGRMPGYGTVLILNHGKRYYTLYGRLAEVDVEPGALVLKEQRIAALGAKDAEGRNFYFEVRKNGSPLDPRTFFAKD